MIVIFLPTALIVLCPACRSVFKAHLPHISSQNCHQVDYVNKRKTFHAKTLRGGKQKARPKSPRKYVRELKMSTMWRVAKLLQFVLYKFQQGKFNLFKRRESCGNKMPTRCNRGFNCRSYCLLNMFRASLCPSSGAQDYYTVVVACGISCCKM